MSTGTISSCPAVGYYGVISAQPVTNIWTVGQPLQIVLDMCSTSPPSSDVPIDVVAWASACYQASFGNPNYLGYTCYDAFLGDLGNLAYYPANQSQAKITITIPPLVIPNMYPLGTYNGLLGLNLSVKDPRGTSGLITEIPMTIASPGATTTTSVSTTTTKIVTSTQTTTYQTIPIITVTTSPTTTLTQTTTVIPKQSMTQTTTPPLAVAPTSTPVTYIAIGAAAIIALAGLGYWLYSRRKK
jgi:hypothetical protein